MTTVLLTRATRSTSKGMAGQLSGLVFSTAVGVANNLAGYSNWDFHDQFQNAHFELHPERVVDDPLFAKAPLVSPEHLSQDLDLERNRNADNLRLTLGTDLAPNSKELCGIMAKVTTTATVTTMHRCERVGRSRRAVSPLAPDEAVSRRSARSVGMSRIIHLSTEHIRCLQYVRRRAWPR